MAEAPLLEKDAESAWRLFVLGVEDPSPPPHGDAEGAAWLRSRLQELGFTQGAFARFMIRRGDTRPKRNVQRSIQRMCAGQARVPGEMRVLLGLMLRAKRRKTARLARERDEREAPWNDPPEARPERREKDAPGASGSASSKAPDMREERDEREAPPGDLSGTSGEQRPPGSGMAGR